MRKETQQKSIRLPGGIVADIQQIAEDSKIQTESAKGLDQPLSLLLHHHGPVLAEDFEDGGDIHGAVEEAKANQGYETDARCPLYAFTRAGEIAEDVGLSGANRAEAITVLVDRYAEDLAELYTDTEADPVGDHEKLRGAYGDWKAYKSAKREHPIPEWLDESAVKPEPDYTEIDDLSMGVDSDE